jgi:hypothetical protein
MEEKEYLTVQIFRRPEKGKPDRERAKKPLHKITWDFLRLLSGRRICKLIGGWEVSIVLM